MHAELFCFGGQNNEGEVLGSLEVRHFGTGSTYGAPMKERRYGLVGVAIGNHIYAVGKQFVCRSVCKLVLHTLLIEKYFL